MCMLGCLSGAVCPKSMKSYRQKTCCPVGGPPSGRVSQGNPQTGTPNTHTADPRKAQAELLLAAPPATNPG